LLAGQRLIQHVTVARRLAKDDRNDDASQVLRLGLDAAEQDETGIKFLVCITAAEAALSAGDRKLAAKAVRISIGAAMAEQVPALALSYALVVWHKQLGGGPLGE
jgi:ethanolamine utilization microcompartment shell protein EutS